MNAMVANYRPSFSMPQTGFGSGGLDPFSTGNSPFFGLGGDLLGMIQSQVQDTFNQTQFPGAQARAYAAPQNGYASARAYANNPGYNYPPPQRYSSPTPVQTARASVSDTMPAPSFSTGGATASVVDDMPPPPPPPPPTAPIDIPQAVTIPVPQAPPVIQAARAPRRRAARVYGDPHFQGLNGSTYNVQGTPNSIYSLVSDKGFQMNGRFKKYDKPGREGTTLINETGFRVGSDQIHLGMKGTPTLNGKAVRTGQTYKLDKGAGSMTWDGSHLHVKSREYGVNVNRLKENLDYNMTANRRGVTSDGVTPHGLLGQTTIGKAKHSKDSQGKGVIQGTVQDYRVSKINGTDDKFNRFTGVAKEPPTKAPAKAAHKTAQAQEAKATAVTPHAAAAKHPPAKKK